eukprot:COSAG01_NODE_3520_length_5979_cov_3.900170_4_plen_236_part_00
MDRTTLREPLLRKSDTECYGWWSQHFNIDAAVTVVAVLHVLLFMLELHFHDSQLMAPLMIAQPRLNDLRVCGGAQCETTTLCQTLGPLVFWIVLCTAHHFREAPNVFLDICCIAQDSDEAKAQGIASLGAILDRSERMLALVSSDYFSRLWCVFEYAAFTQRAGRGRIDVVPVHKALSTLGFVLSFTIYYLICACDGHVAPQAQTLPSPMHPMTGVGACFGCCAAGGVHGRHYRR